MLAKCCFFTFLLHQSWESLDITLIDTFFFFFTRKRLEMIVVLIDYY